MTIDPFELQEGASYVAWHKRTETHVQPPAMSDINYQYHSFLDAHRAATKYAGEHDSAFAVRAGGGRYHVMHEKTDSPYSLVAHVGPQGHTKYTLDEGHTEQD